MLLLPLLKHLDYGEITELIEGLLPMLAEGPQSLPSITIKQSRILN